MPKHATATGEALPAPFHLFDLTGRVAVVTGASSGLGEALARALAGAGAKVAVVARRKDRLEGLAAAVDGLAVGADLLELDRVHEIAAAVASELGPPEILVNAAGGVFAPPNTRPEDEALEDILNTIHLDLVAAHRLSQALHPSMAEVGRGSIVNISSISGHVGIPAIPNASYAAAKLGLSGLTKDLAVHWAEDGIRVNTVAAGYFRSEITAPLFDSEKGDAWLRRNTPLPYLGTTEDFVGTVLLLVSDAGRYVTGQTILVDGGWTSA